MDGLADAQTAGQTGLFVKRHEDGKTGGRTTQRDGESEKYVEDIGMLIALPSF